MTMRLNQTSTLVQRARAFSTTPNLSRLPRSNPAHLLPEGAPPPPEYPYPPNYWFKQSNRGLYGGRMKQFGNIVTEKKILKNPSVSRRTWNPNTQFKRIQSRALQRTLRLRISTSVLRTIKKVGGFDEYVTGIKPARLKELGPEGWNFRWAVLKSGGMKRRIEKNKSLKRYVENMTKLEKEMAERESPKTVISVAKPRVTRLNDQWLDERLNNVGASQHMHEEPPPPPPPPSSWWQRLVPQRFRRA